MRQLIAWFTAKIPLDEIFIAPNGIFFSLDVSEKFSDVSKKFSGVSKFSLEVLVNVPISARLSDAH
jgi:hypothetical protein